MFFEQRKYEVNDILFFGKRNENENGAYRNWREAEP